MSNHTDPPRNVTVLLVDDDPVILRCHARFLNDEFAFETCVNAEDAAQRVTRGGIDVVVSDVTMPGMGGFELLGTIRKGDAYLPVILASALSAGDSSARALSQGAFVYLTKPVDPAMFRAAVRLAVQYRRGPRTERPPSND